MNEILEQLKNLKFENPDFQAGFSTALQMALAIDMSHFNKIKELERDIMRLQLRITTLETDKHPYRWYPYVTYCDSSAPATSGTVYKSCVTSSDSAKITKP